MQLDVFIGGKLKKQRLRLGLSQAKLAEALHVSQQLIQKQESGEARIQASMLYDLAVLLGVTPNYFYEGYSSDAEGGGAFPPKKGDVIRNRPKARYNILLVEDNPEDEILFRKALEENACSADLHACYNGVDALAFLRGVADEQPCRPFPDFIFLDLNIPKKDGLAVLKEIKQDRAIRFIPVIVLTNSVNAEEMFECYKFHAGGYVCKSFDLNNFYRKIAVVLEYWTKTVVTPQNY
jgi:chemotaxis family two-component system response regulator Rcp1